MYQWFQEDFNYVENIYYFPGDMGIREWFSENLQKEMSTLWG